MARIVLVMHSPLGASFADCARHVLGQDPKLTVFDVQADASPDECVDRLSGILAEQPDEGVLILCDIYGATPFNIAQRAVQQANLQGQAAHLVTGTNLCMVLKALTDQQENPDELSENVRQGALKGIVDANCSS